ncbi:rhodanese-like domain-containing protein [Litorivicinus lipolyticus]|uniref:rhodanese-like domain-containing protein n=1 Tax=Litorivicinus lipolyticus TaxID=418701 RepID=UPI003B5CB0AF
MKKIKHLTAALLAVTFATAALADGPMIKRGVASVTVELGDKTCVIERNATAGNQVHEAYNKTGQGMPQPMIVSAGIDTLGELEFIDYMEQASVDSSILVVDTRTENWHEDLHIPCTTNVSFKNFADIKDDALFYLTEVFGVEENDDGSLNFDNAKTIVGYCNGYWCGQTPAMFKRAKYSMVALGYPVEKLKYYRGGMQAWTSLGLTVEGALAK